MESKNSNKAWLYLLPVLLVMAVFTFYPLVKTVAYSFLEGYRNNTFNTVKGFGLGNYTRVFRYPGFISMMKNTFIIVFVSVPISVVLSLLIAVALNSIKPLQKVFQTIFFLPYVTNGIAIGLVFSVMFSSQSNTGGVITGLTGVINSIITTFGGQEINFLNAGASYGAQMFVLIAYIVWNSLAFKILILLGGLQNINKQLYDAAKIDATPKRRVFTKITVPLLSPMIAYTAVTSFIGAFKEYTSVVSIFGADMGVSGQENGMQTIVGFIYGNKLENGMVSAASMILFFIIMFFTFINLFVSKKKVHY